MKRFLSILASAAILVSCSNPLADKANGKGIVTISIADARGGDSASRTVLPEIAVVIDTYTVTLTSNATPPFATKTPPSIPKTINSLAIPDVENGSWNIQVDAKDSGGVVVARAIAVNQTVASTGLSVALALTPVLTGGAGNLSLTVDFPAVTNINSISCSLENADGTVSSTVPTVSGFTGTDPKSVTISATGLSSGIYSLVMNFTGGGVIVGTFRESVLISSGLTSDKWVAADGTLTDRRVFSASEFGNSNSDLSGLLVAGLNATQLPFVNGTLDYTVSDLPRDTLVFTPTESVPGQKIEYEWNQPGTVASIVSGSASIPLALKSGRNTLDIFVTSPNRVTQKNYRLTINQNNFYTSSSAVAMQMAKVPAGMFQRDATATNTSYVSEFMIGKYEVTQAQWRLVASTTYPAGTSDCLLPIAGTLTWYDMIGFCNELSLMEGLDPVYSIAGWNGLFPVSTASVVSADWTKNGYRLPTEMEWMWAAMGAANDRFQGYTGIGTNTKGYSKAFAGDSGSNAASDYAWYGCAMQAVGQKLPNELGLYDMSGNVFEWCWDKGDYPPLAYPIGALTNYRNESELYRVDRGGSFFRGTGELAIAYRIAADQAGQGADLGFRVARGLEKVFVYVTNQDDDSISVFRLNQYTGSLVSQGAPVPCPDPFRIAIDPSKRFLYTANKTSDGVSAYSISRSSGLLSNIGIYSPGSSPQDIVVDEGGKYVYVANGASENIRAYSINQTTGALTSLPFAYATAAGGQPMSLAIKGNFLYCVNYFAAASASAIQSFPIDPFTGELGAASNAPAAIDGHQNGLGISDKYMYLGNGWGPYGIRSAMFDPTTGVIGALVNTATSAWPLQDAICVDPQGQYVFYPVSGPAGLWRVTLDNGTGSVAAHANSGLVISYAAFDPTGAFVLGLEGTTLRAYSLDRSTGDLTVPDPSSTTGAGPTSVVTVSIP